MKINTKQNKNIVYYNNVFLVIMNLHFMIRH